MSQSVDKAGAADYLGISVATVTRRITNGTFPPPDAIEGLIDEVQWWELTTLDKYKRSLARKARRNKNPK